MRCEPNLKHLGKAALILSSGSDDVYGGVIYEYHGVSRIREFGCVYCLWRAEQILGEWYEFEQILH